MLVEPRVLDGAFLYLPGRQEGLGVLSVYHISVHIHIVERIVLPYGLGLIVESVGRLIVVYPDVGYSLIVIADILGRQIIAGREFPCINIVQPVGRLREFDVAFQILTLLVYLVRSNDQVLDQQPGSRSDQADDYHQHRHCHHVFHASLVYTHRESDGGYHRQHHNYPVHPEGHIDSRESRSVNCSCVFKQQPVLSQEKVYSHHEKEQYAHDDQLLFGNAHQHLQVLVIQRSASGRPFEPAIAGFSREGLGKLTEHSPHVSKRRSAAGAR